MVGGLLNAWLLVAAIAMVPVAATHGPVVLPIGLAVYVASLLLHEAAHLAGALASGVPRSRIRFTGGHTSVSRNVTRRQDLVTWVSGPAPNVLLLALSFGLGRPAGVVLGVANAIVLVATLLPDCTGNTDGSRIAGHVIDWNERRRIVPLRRAAARLEGPTRFDGAVALASPYVRRQPQNYVLMTFVMTRLVAALRPVDAAALVHRYAGQYGLRPAARHSALVLWCDLVLTYPDLMPEHVEEAIAYVEAHALDDSFAGRYLEAVTALRRGRVEAALAAADQALAWTRAGETVDAHALGCVHGVRALALHALGRADEAAAALRAGTEADRGCLVPDMLDEARAALAA